MTDRRQILHHVVALAVIVALAGGFWIHRVYIDRPQEHGFGDADLRKYFYPTVVFMHRELREGGLPLWNPYQLAGIPFVSLHQPGVLYPPNLVLMALLRPARALEAHALFHIIVAGWGTWIFAARLGLDPAARLAAALAFMLSPPIISRIYNPAYLSTIAWLPLILAAVHGIVRAARLRSAVALSLLLTLAFLAGYSQGFLYEVQLALAYGLVGVVLWTPPGSRRRALVGGMACALVTLGLVAAQLLPTLELARQGSRSLEGLSLEAASTSPFGPLPPAALLRGLIGKLTAGDEWGDWTRVNAAFLSLPLVACGLADRRRRGQWMFFATAAALTAAFMLGPETPFFAVYYRLPLGNLFRTPYRMAFVYIFSLSVLAGIGVQGVCELSRRMRHGARLAALVAAALALAVGVDLYRRTPLPFSHPVLGPEARYAPAELIAWLRAAPGRERVFLVEGRSLQVKAGMMNGIFAVPDYEPLLPQLYERYFTRGSRTAEPPARHRSIWQGGIDVVGRPRRTSVSTPARLLDLMSVRYYAIDTGPDADLRRELEAFGGGTATAMGAAHVVERPSALPRVYVVHWAVREADPERALRILTDPAFDPRGEVIVDREVPGLEPIVPASPGSAVISSYRATEVTIAATCHASCLVVLTDLDYPGWTATVDGEPVEIYRANVLFRAVRLTPGDHLVRFRYRPTSFRLGSWISLVTVALFASGAIWTGTTVRRRHAGEGAGRPAATAD